MQVDKDSVVGGITYSKLKIEKIPIGYGGYGDVYAGTYEDIKVAVKKQTRLDAKTSASFMKEINILAGAKHINIMRYLGSCESDKGELCIVSELLSDNLSSVCIENDNRKPKLYDRIKYACDCAAGIRYLHKCGIIHRDVKPENFLLNLEKTRAIVCDFGISHIVSESEAIRKSGKRMRKTPLWSSPEVDRNDSVITEKSDVYSFGLFLWSMLVCKNPFEGKSEEEIVQMKQEGSLSINLDKSKFEEINIGSRRKKVMEDIKIYEIENLLELIKKCTELDPAKRPGFEEISESLQKIHMDIAIVDPFCGPKINSSILGRNPKAHGVALRAWWERSFIDENGNVPLSVEWDEFINKFYAMSEISPASIYMIERPEEQKIHPEYKDISLKIKCLKTLIDEKGTSVALERFCHVACRLGPFDIYSKQYLDRAKELLRCKYFFGDVEDCDSTLEKNRYLLRYCESVLTAYTVSHKTNDMIKKMRLKGKFVEREKKPIFVYCYDEFGSESIIDTSAFYGRKMGYLPCETYYYKRLFEEVIKTGYDEDS